MSDAVTYGSLLGHCLDLRGSKLGGSSVARQNGFLQERLQVLGHQGGRGEQSVSAPPGICRVHTYIHTGHWRLLVCSHTYIMSVTYYNKWVHMYCRSYICTYVRTYVHIVTSTVHPHLHTPTPTPTPFTSRLTVEVTSTAKDPPAEDNTYVYV